MLTRFERSRLFIVLLACTLVSACAASDRSDTRGSGPATAAQPSDAPKAGSPTLAAADRSSPSRRIIRNAELRLEVTAPEQAQRDAVQLAERLGGYVVSTESRDAGERDVGFTPSSVRIVLRVPAHELTGAMAELKKLGVGSGSESIRSEDLTEEYVDLEARLRTQKRLEEQYLSILKGATKVDDALSVQKELATVRTEVEKLEGRKRFIDTQVSLSTITLELSEHRPLVTATFSQIGRSVKRALGDTVNVAAAIAVGWVRLLAFLLPFLLLVVVPGVLVVRFVVRSVLGRTRPSSVAAA